MEKTHNFLGFLSVLSVSLFASVAHSATLRIESNGKLKTDWTVSAGAKLTAQYVCNTHYKASGNACVPNIYTVTLDHREGSQPTVNNNKISTIYEKYGVGFFANNTAELGICIDGNKEGCATLKSTRTGYTFNGYYTATTGGTQIINANGQVASTSANLEELAKTFTNNDGKLYAQWTANTNTKYVVNHYTKNLGATTYTLNSTDNKTGTTDASLTLANLKKTITGFTYSKGFAGTATKGTSMPESGAVTTTKILGDGTRIIDLYYTRNTYTITVDKNGGSGTLTVGLTTKTGEEDVTVSCEYESTVALPAWGTANNMVNDKKVFTGWDPSSSVTCDATKTIKAKWEIPTCVAGTGVNESKLTGVFENAPVCSLSSKAGYYCNTATQTGTAGARSLTVSCTAASDGHYAVAGATKQTACPIGSYSEKTSASTKCTPCPGGRTTSGTGTKYNATANTACSVTCSNNANAATWATPTWFEGSVTNLCKIDTCANKYVRTGSTALDKSYVCSACTCTPGAHVASCTPHASTNNQCSYAITCANGYTGQNYGTNNNAGVANFETAACTANTINLAWTTKHGTAPTSPKTCTYGNFITKPTNGTSEMDENGNMVVYGHVFGGWSVNNKTLTFDKPRRCDFDTLGTYGDDGKTVTLTAVWDNVSHQLPLYDGQGFENQGKIYYVPNGGFYLDAELTKQIQKTLCDSNSLTNPCTGHTVTKPKRDGYTFGGYMLSSSGATSINANGEVSGGNSFIVTSDTRLEAIWNPICNKITLDNTTNGGTGGTTELYKLTDSTAWYKDNKCSEVVTELPSKPTKDHATYDGHYQD